MKVEKDNPKAIALFREALALNPSHEDSHYYLGLCLASQADPDGALAQLDELKRINPQSHRAFQQWGVLRAMFARTPADLAAAEKSLERAHASTPKKPVRSSFLVRFPFCAATAPKPTNASPTPAAATRAR
jgi:tetratricopeptide (TPR) repeat protein